MGLSPSTTTMQPRSREQTQVANSLSTTLMLIITTIIQLARTRALKRTVNPSIKEHKTYFKQKSITRGILDVDLEKPRSTKVQTVELAPIGRYFLPTPLSLYNSLFSRYKTRSYSKLIFS